MQMYSIHRELVGVLVGADTPYNDSVVDGCLTGIPVLSCLWSTFVCSKDNFLHHYSSFCLDKIELRDAFDCFVVVLGYKCMKQANSLLTRFLGSEKPRRDRRCNRHTSCAQVASCRFICCCMDACALVVLLSCQQLG
jgi:hypothetical protein